MGSILKRLPKRKGGTAQKTAQKTTQKEERAAQKLTELQQAVMEYLECNPFATRKELRENIQNISEDGVKYTLVRLQKLGLLKRVGGRKNGHWVVGKTLSEKEADEVSERLSKRDGTVQKNRQ